MVLHIYALVAGDWLLMCVCVCRTEVEDIRFHTELLVEVKAIREEVDSIQVFSLC